MLAQQLTRSFSVGTATNTLATKFTAFTQARGRKGTFASSGCCKLTYTETANASQTDDK